MNPNHDASPASETDPLPSVSRQALPCLFLVEVKEGFATSRIEDRDQLIRALEYCRREGYTVRRVASPPGQTAGRPACDRYIASKTPLKEPAPGAVTAQATAASQFRQ